MELRRYLTILRRRWLLIVITVAFAAVAGYLVTPGTRHYSAQSTVYIGSRVLGASDTSQLNISNDRQIALADVARSFSIMIGSPPVARDAIDASNVPRTPEQVVGETKVVAQTSQLLVITVTDTEPAVAQKLADGMADAFVAKVQQLEPGSTEGALPTLPAYKFESASLPVVPLPSDLSKNLVLAALFGLLVSCAVAFVLEYLDLTVRTVEDAERRFGLPVLGVIPELGKGLAPATQRLQPVDEIGTARGA